ncbi:MAG: type II CAAX prenyl endopeptidase Rce1 family protein [Bacillota bacterium]
MEPAIRVESKVDLGIVVVLGCAILTGALDALMGVPGMLFTDIPFVGITGCYGLVWARATGAPQLIRRSESTSGRKMLLLYILLATTLLLTVINTVNNVGYFRNNSPSSQPLQMMLSTPWKGFLLAMRAGITEEIPFRLFAGPVARWLLQRSIKTKGHALWLAPLLTAFPFALVVHPASPLAYLSSLLLSFLYFEYGAMPAIAAHFFMDVVWTVLVPLMGLV